MEGLAENVERVLTGFVASAQAAFASDLVSVVLYGSAAEGRMRATSDVNVIVVLSRFDGSAAARMTEPLNLACTAVRLRAMFLITDEVNPASEAFAQKFSDVMHRRKILFGPDPFAGIEISRQAKIYRLKQVLLNLTLRLRESYISHSGNEKALEGVVAESSGPIRTSAAALLELEGEQSRSPKDSFEALVAGQDPPLSAGLASSVSDAREFRPLAHGAARATLLDLIELASRMRLRAGRLA